MMHSRRAFLRMAFAPQEAVPSRNIVVQVFLRGGADGLALVPPVGDDAYYAARPRLGIPRPDARSADRALALDGRFGLHPALAPLHAIYRAGELAVVHAAGSEDTSRSHFEAQDLMERGCPVNRDLASGWLARHLRTMRGSRTPLAAIAIADVMPETLRGSPGASAVRDLDAFSLRVPEAMRPRFAAALGSLYGRDRTTLGDAGKQVLETLATIERLREGGAREEAHDFPSSLRQVARLIRAEVGLEVACVDLDGWDTHFVQAEGFDPRAGELARGLAAFWHDVRDFRSRVTVVVLTEFGRRVHENISLGTDHGRGSVMFVMGGGVRGGRVIAEWPGLAEGALEEPGDLRVTIDYRDILGEIVSKRLGNDRLADVFPGHRCVFRGLTA